MVRPQWVENAPLPKLSTIECINIMYYIFYNIYSVKKITLICVVYFLGGLNHASQWVEKTPCVEISKYMYLQLRDIFHNIKIHYIIKRLGHNNWHDWNFSTGSKWHQTSGSILHQHHISETIATTIFIFRIWYIGYKTTMILKV